MFLRTRYQNGKPPCPRLFLLGANHPVRCGPSITGNLALEKLPCRPIRAKVLFLCRAHFRRLPLFVGVEGRPFVGSLLKRGEACRTHSSGGGEFLNPSDVDRTPGAAWLARREPDRVADFVQAFSHPINPPEAQCLIHRLRPGNAWCPATFLVETRQ